MSRQFDPTYRLTPGTSDNPGNQKKQRFIEDFQIQKQQELENRPANISFFKNLMTLVPEKQTLRIGCFCNMIPFEIIRALGMEPVRLDCGNAGAAILGDEILAGDICPLAKASLGALLCDDTLASSCDAYILPTSCDAKKKMGQICNDYKPTFMLNLPPEQNHKRYQKQSLGEITRLTEFLEKISQKKLKAKKLYKEIKLSNHRTQLLRNMQELRIQKPRSLSIADLFLIIQSGLFQPIELTKWLEESKKVYEEMKQYEPPRKNLRPRLILTGAPIIWPNYKILNLFEESGADIIADTLCTGVQSCFDPIIASEKGLKALLQALTNRYLFATICPCFITQDTRINRVLDLQETTKADGIINYSLRLCQLFDIENFRLEKIVKGNKIPYINVRTDYSLEDTEQLRIRIEAFLETIE